MAVIPQLLHVLRCLNSATLQKSVCSCVPEKEDSCFIHPDRKGNNEQRGTNKGSKMLVVEEMKTVENTQHVQNRRNCAVGGTEQDKALLRAGVRA